METGTKLLVERRDQLLQMADAASRSKQEGELLVVSGEAGHGKTSVIEAFCAGLDHRYSIMAGACDPVSVPTPFAPLFEFLPSLPEELGTRIREGDERHEIYAGMLAVMETEPTVLIIEDLQWADEATLGLVRFLGRRLSRTRSLLVLSYRPEEVDTAHPLLVVLADLGSTVTNVVVPPLSVVGVGEMAAGSDVDPASIHRATGGNPFFVEEILANPGDELSVTISAAVMARVASLPTGSLDLLEMVALSPEGVDLSVAQGYSPEAERNIDEACRRRLLIEDRGRLRCRHDLIRLTVDHSVPPARRRRIHLRLLETIEAAAPSRRDMARLAHHAVEAREEGKAIEYSLAAAAFAEAKSANREARRHYESALGFRDEMDPPTLDRALRGAAEVNCATNNLPEATAAARDRVALAADTHDRADRLAWSAFIASRWGNVTLAREDATRAIDLHRDTPQCFEIARAQFVLATLAVWDADWLTASDLSTRTVELARAAGSRELLADGLLTLGKAEALLGRQGWEKHLNEAVRMGKQLGQLETACAGLNWLAFLSYWNFDLEVARDRFDTAIDFATANEMDAWYVAMASSKAACDLAAGHWEEAATVLERAIAWPTCSSTDCDAKILLATLRSRQGDADSGALVIDALKETDRGGTYTEKVAATTLAMEGAWLGVLDEQVAVERYDVMSIEVDRVSDVNADRRLDFWASMLGWKLSDSEKSDDLSDPGDWSERGFSYEARLLEATLDDPPLSEIFEWLEGRGAEGVMRALRRDLRDKGARGIPRSRRQSTTSNPAGLTARQLEVLELVASGHTNADIASELYISEKTVGHHVSAILQKLSVENRVQAAAIANEDGLI